MSKRANGEGSIYQRGDGVWVGAMTFGWGDGTRQRKTVYGHTQREARTKLDAIRRAAQENRRPAPERLTVGQFLDRWMAESVAPHVRPKTLATYQGIVRLHIRPTLGQVRLNQLAPLDVQGILAARRASGLSPRTTAMIREVLRNALNQAVRLGLIARNPAALADAPAAPRRRLTPLSGEQARAFIAAVEDDRLGALFTVAIAVGLRQGEALGLRWQDVDLEDDKLTVAGALQRTRGGLRRVEPKTELSHRTIALPDIVSRRLRAHRTRQLEERILAGSRWAETGYVFTTTVGTPLDGPAVTKRLHRLLDEAGLPQQRFHDLRHACASLLLAQGVPARVVMETLGHSDIRLTLNTYSHVLPEIQRQAATQMDVLLASG